MGIRPEDISLGDKTLGKLVEAEIYVVDPLGSEAIVDLEVGQNILKVKTGLDLSLSMGCIEVSRPRE
jgi:ABC-type sugar transport system ATPase subunit